MSERCCIFLAVPNPVHGNSDEGAVNFIFASYDYMSVQATLFVPSRMFNEFTRAFLCVQLTLSANALLGGVARGFVDAAALNPNTWMLSR